jgi:hypothetical protein
MEHMGWFNPPFFIGFHGEVPPTSWPGTELGKARPEAQQHVVRGHVLDGVHPVLDSVLNVVSITKVTKVSNIDVSNMVSMTLLKLNHPIN